MFTKTTKCDYVTPCMSAEQAIQEEKFICTSVPMGITDLEDGEVINY